jgi:DNA-binding transcriptional ArsR family regulator
MEHRARAARAGVGGGVGPVFDALGDPGRRELLQTISERGSATATELAAGRGVTRQAVAKQLATLADAGLLEARREGRETRYVPTPEPLSAAMAWLVEVGRTWDERLAALGQHLARRGRPSAR